MTRKEKAKRPVSLQEWQRMAKRIFGKKNEMHYSPQDLLLHIMEETAKISKGFRRHDGDKTELVSNIPYVFFWLLAFCNMAKIDLAEAVWEKYHGGCPYCGAETDCNCIKAKTKMTSWRKNPNGRMPAGLDDWQKMFARIYGRINKTYWPLVVWLHVLEELGECSQEFRLGRNVELEEELADFFSWLVGYCNRMDVNLAEISWQTYPGACLCCGKSKCECPKV
jgi:NTP pyrophosphatase (non-canonical NTP hydrolase)